MRPRLRERKLPPTHKEAEMKAKITETSEKAQLKVLLTIGGTTMMAIVAGAGVVTQGPGRP